MIVGIDIGGSTTDAVILENGSIRVVTIEANDPVAAAAGALGKIVGDVGINLSDIECVAATGAGSRALGDQLFGRPVMKVNEFTAIGVGGTSLAKKDRALVVSLGTGTAIVSVIRPRFAMSAAPALAAARCSVSRNICWEFRASIRSRRWPSRGDLHRVDLSVRDIAGGPIGDLPPGTTAANFGKVSSDATQDDKALAIMNMIVEVIGVLAIATARACDQNDIVLTGKLTRIFRFMQNRSQARIRIRSRHGDSRACRLCDGDRRRAHRAQSDQSAL